MEDRCRHLTRYEDVHRYLQVGIVFKYLRGGKRQAHGMWNGRPGGRVSGVEEHHLWAWTVAMVEPRISVISSLEARKARGSPWTITTSNLALPLAAPGKLASLELPLCGLGPCCPYPWARPGVTSIPNSAREEKIRECISASRGRVPPHPRQMDRWV